MQTPQSKLKNFDPQKDEEIEFGEVKPTVWQALPSFDVRKEVWQNVYALPDLHILKVMKYIYVVWHQKIQKKCFWETEESHF